MRAIIVAVVLITGCSSNEPTVPFSDPSSPVKVLAARCVTVSGSSETVHASRVMGKLRQSGRSSQPEERLASSKRYTLVLVGGEALPVASPWGVGEWDYDADAGTWKLTHAEIVLFGNGCFSYTIIHRAASGAMISDTSIGHYTRSPDSVQFVSDSGARWAVAVTASGLVDRWSDGTTLIYER